MLGKSALRVLCCGGQLELRQILLKQYMHHVLFFTVPVFLLLIVNRDPVGVGAVDGRTAHKQVDYSTQQGVAMP